MPPRRLEHAQRPEHVHVCVVVGAIDRDAHVGLRREVEAHLGSRLVEDGVRVGADVGHVEAGAVREVLVLAAREVVEHVHLVAALEEPFGDVRADEPRSPGDDGPHPPILGASCS